jgi:sugar transferase (PEP-CTERM system associated)
MPVADRLPSPSSDRTAGVLTGLTTGRLLFVLDAAAFATIWPVILDVIGAASPVAIIVYPLAALAGLYATGLYRRDALLDTRQALARVPVAVTVGVAGGAALVAVIGAGDLSWRRPVVGALGFTMAACLTRLAMRAVLQLGLMRRRVLVVGAGRQAWDLLFLLETEGRSPQYAMMFLHDPVLGDVDPRLPEAQVIRSKEFDVVGAATLLDADVVVVAPDERRAMPLPPLLACKRRGFPVVRYLTFLEREVGRLDLSRLDLGFLLYAEGYRMGFFDRAAKRILDIAVAGLLLILAMPLLAAAMVAIRLDAPGPIFYRQTRVTQDERQFRILKLRTMRPDAEAGGAIWAQTADQRITRVGRFLRRTRIDELPQLINVLRGEMSFVGPRPERPEFVVELAQAIPLYHERHAVKAGLTGWAQINYPYGASVEDARSKLSYDLYYVKNSSISLDMLILMQTMRVVLFGGGAR